MMVCVCVKSSQRYTQITKKTHFRMYLKQERTFIQLADPSLSV